MKTLVAALIFSLLLVIPAYAKGKSGDHAQVKEMRKIEHPKPALPKIKQTVPQKLPQPPKQVAAPPKVSAPSAVAKLPPGLSKRAELPAGLAKKGKTPDGWEKGQKKGWIEQGAENENLESAESALGSDESTTGKSFFEERSGKPKKEQVKKQKGDKKK